MLHTMSAEFQSTREQLPDGGQYLIMTQGNARVSILVNQEVWCDDDGYADCDIFRSSARLTELYARYNDAMPRAPKGLARRMLCLGLGTLLEEGFVHPEGILVLEADESDDDLLVKRVYRPMSFDVVGREKYGTALMFSVIRDVLRWCEAHTNGY